jgi:hypothetical protein
VRETTVSACATQLYIRIDNLDTSEYLSKMLGETTIELKRASLRRGGILGQKTINTDYDAVPLRTPQQLRQMDPRKIILLVSSAPPFELERVIYHDDRPYKQALEQVRFKSVDVPELEPYSDLVPVSEATDRPIPVAMSVAKVAAASTSSFDGKILCTGRQSLAADSQIMNQGSGLNAQDFTNAEPHRSALPTIPSPSAESIPLEAVLTAQIDAGAAAFRKVMEGLPEDGAHRELLNHLQQMTTLHQDFGDDSAAQVEFDDSAFHVGSAFRAKIGSLPESRSSKLLD